MSLNGLTSAATRKQLVLYKNNPKKLGFGWIRSLVWGFKGQSKHAPALFKSPVSSIILFRKIMERFAIMGPCDGKMLQLGDVGGWGGWVRGWIRKLYSDLHFSQWNQLCSPLKLYYEWHFSYFPSFVSIWASIWGVKWSILVSFIPSSI